MHRKKRSKHFRFDFLEIRFRQLLRWSLDIVSVIITTLSMGLFLVDQGRGGKEEKSKLVGRSIFLILFSPESEKINCVPFGLA